MANPRVNRALLAAVERWLAEAVPFGEIASRAATGYRVSERTVARYVSRVYARWESEEREHRPRRRAEFRQMLRHLWRLAIEAKDYRSAASVAQRLAKLDGLEAPKEHRIEATTGRLDVRSMTPRERQDRIDHLLALRRRAQAS